jgi:hypothetical protein
MGVDQHRGQITGEWIDIESGVVQRARVVPADRAGVRRFLQRFCGQRLEVALEATTGWRFVVEELRRVGAVLHLAEPAETAGLRGPKKRAKGDRADACHLRELLMVKRLPESWIPPDHILDLRGRVRLRHTLWEQRCERQQRVQAVLYHHGCPQRRRTSPCISASSAARPGMYGGRGGGVALGVVRGRAGRTAWRPKSRPRVLPGREGGDRRKPCVPVGRAQASEAQLAVRRER